MIAKDFERTYKEDKMYIGYIPGDHNAVLIKTGQGGSIYGYKNKYLDIALNLNKKYGCSVFVLKTITDDRSDFDKEIQLIEEILGDKVKIYYIGISKGGLIGCWYASQHNHVKRILAINAPLMINFHNKTLPALKSAEHGKISMIYGSLDPSYKYIPFVSNYVDVQIIDGADHVFSRHTDILKKAIETVCDSFV